MNPIERLILKALNCLLKDNSIENKERVVDEIIKALSPTDAKDTGEVK